MSKEDALDPAKQNPFVHLEFCDARYIEVNKKLDQVLNTLKGNPNVPEDMGMMGDLRDIKRDRKWIYALLITIGIPTIFLIVNFLMKGG
jgi:hypothetical protein